MRIGLDLDEVLVDFTPAFIEFHNEKYNTCLTINDYYTYDFWRILGVTLDEAVNRVLEFYQTDYFRNMQPVAGAVELVEYLKQGNELFIITSRPEEIVEETKRWVDYWFKGMFSGIHLTNRFSKIVSAKKKADVCLELGVAFLVEDHLESAVECAEEGVRVLLLNKGWNQGELPEGITRIYSLEQVKDYVK